MSWIASFMCFYCGNPINSGSQPHVYAEIVHNYKHGGWRKSDRRFHISCFRKFEREGGRPLNPDTVYEVADAEEVRPAKAEHVS